jgi:hypothetical protein
MEWTIPVLVVLVFIAIIAFSFYLQYLRRQMWQRLAARYGMRFNPDDPFDIPGRFPFALFQEGHSRRASNCLDGTYQNVPVILFDYRYKTGSGKSETTHNLSALLARLNIHCPKLVIRPETVLDRFAAFVGFGDINFESEEFNRAFNVHCADKKFAYDICHPQMMEFLLENRSMVWELQGNHLLLYSYSMGSFDPGEVRTCLQLAVEFDARIPGYLQKEAAV